MRIFICSVLLGGGLLVPVVGVAEDWFELDAMHIAKIGIDGRLCRIDYSEQTRKLTLGQRSPSDEVYESFVVWRSGQLFVAGWGDPLYRSFQANCVPFPAHFRIKAY